MSARSRSASLIASVLQSPTPLPRIRSLHFVWSKRGASQASLRHFLRLKLPIIQFHNPDISVSFSRSPDSLDVKPEIRVTDSQPALQPPWQSSSEGS